MNIRQVNFKKIFNLNSIILFFEKQEFFIIAAGAIISLMMGGWVFYANAYQRDIKPADIIVKTAEIKWDLFKKTANELKSRKIMAPNLPIIDPFD